MYPKTLATLGDHIRARRLDRGLLQKEVALTLGVNLNTVTGWEKNRLSPMTAQLPRIIAFLGYTPPPYDKIPDTLGERIRLYRLTHGLSQERFADFLGVDESTVFHWEYGKHAPSKKLMKKLIALDFSEGGYS